MRNKKKNKYMLLLILLLGISLGYAAISTTLKINGTATVNKHEWNVYWGEPTVTAGSVSMTAPTREADGGNANAKLTWTATLDLPGDYYEFTVDAVNAGDVDAMITGINPTVTPALPVDPEYIKYEVTYADGMTPAVNHLLAKKKGNTPTTEKYKVRVYYDENAATATSMNSMTANTTYTFNLDITYGQATDAAKDHRYFSMGDATYGYETRFQVSDWTLGSKSSVNSNKIVIADNPFLGNSMLYSNFSRELPEDYSFSGRMTINILKNTQDYDGAMDIVFAPEKNSTANSIAIQVDISQSSNHYWRDENGLGPNGDPDGWNFGVEPYPVGVSVNKNGDFMYDLALVEHNSMMTSEYAKEIWYNYNGTEKKLYLYIADYDSNGKVIKPSQPDITLSLDLEEVFQNSHTMYIYMYAEGGWDAATFELYGLEFNPYSE